MGLYPYFLISPLSLAAPSAVASNSDLLRVETLSKFLQVLLVGLQSAESQVESQVISVQVTIAGMNLGKHLKRMMRVEMGVDVLTEYINLLQSQISSVRDIHLVKDGLENFGAMGNALSQQKVSDVYIS
jgi:hypothetical protein